MTSKLAHAIYEARRAARLTQAELAMRLGLKARAVGRWELGQSAPRKRHRAPLVATIRIHDAAAADQLAKALVGDPPKRAPAVPPAPAPPDPDTVLELAVLRLADELDLPPRRVRGPLVRLLGRVAGAGFNVESARARIETWIADTD